MSKYTKDEALIALLKSALEYNAEILANASLLVGKMKDTKPTYQKRIYYEFKKIHDNYTKTHAGIIADIEPSKKELESRKEELRKIVGDE